MNGSSGGISILTVSILVLLDVALKASIWNRATGSSGSFNPCSLGCCSESRWKVHPDPGRRTGFNPCSLGCCSESLIGIIRRSPLPVSILVLLDVALKVRACGETWSPGGVSILVLLDVALKGCTWWCTRCTRNTFQSLFSWMLLWKTNHYFCITTLFFLFQSLFSWMLLWKSRISRSRNGVTRFQSLFSWMLLWKPWSVPGVLGRSRVSILVLLDVALKEWYLLFVGVLAYEVSILVLLDVALKAILSHSRHNSFLGFNPCSLGCCSESSAIAPPRPGIVSFNPCSLGCCSESGRGLRYLWFRFSFNPCSLGCCSESRHRSNTRHRD